MGQEVDGEAEGRASGGRGKKKTKQRLRLPSTVGSRGVLLNVKANKYILCGYKVVYVSSGFGHCPLLESLCSVLLWLGPLLVLCRIDINLENVLTGK